MFVVGWHLLRVHIGTQHRILLAGVADADHVPRVAQREFQYLQGALGGGALREGACRTLFMWMEEASLKPNSEWSVKQVFRK